MEAKVRLQEGEIESEKVRLSRLDEDGGSIARVDDVIGVVKLMFSRISLLIINHITNISLSYKIKKSLKKYE